MALLDVSAAFDTLDYSVLLKWHETTYGVRDTVLDYLSGYFQSVIVDGVVSTSCMACPRVPCWDQSCLLCTLSLCQM